MNFIVGNYDFKSILKDGYYINKSEIINEIFSYGNASKIMVITRPRRFGKSLMMSMLTAFLNIEDDYLELLKEFNSNPIYAYGVAFQKNCCRYLRKN